MKKNFKEKRQSLVTNLQRAIIFDGIYFKRIWHHRNGSMFRLLTENELGIIKRTLFYKKLNTIALLICIILVITVVGGDFITGRKSQAAPNSIKKSFTNSQNTIKTNTNPEPAENNWFYNANRVEIPAIKLSAQVSYPKNASETDDYLKTSVVHVFDSKLPEEEGTVIIAGHSSSTQKAIYGDVFATITKVKQDDDIYLIKDGQKYHYRAISIQRLSATDKSLYSLGPKKLVLATCWPVGTNLMRYAVVADMVEK